MNPQPSPQVGDVLTYRLPDRLQEGSPGKTLAPESGDSLLDQGFDILSEKSESPNSAPTFRLAPTKAGRLTLPSLAVRDANGKAIARTNPVEVNVLSAISPDDKKPTVPAEMKDPVGLSFPIFAAIGLALLAIAIAIVSAVAIRRYLARERKTKPLPEIPKAPPRPEDEEALDRLNSLEKLGWMMRGQPKRHYFGVSEILKAYLGRRYEFDAQESTSAELVNRLKYQVSSEILARVERLYAEMDLVKFTDHVPPLEQGQAILEGARALVQMTRKPKVQTAETTKEGAPRAV